MAEESQDLSKTLNQFLGIAIQRRWVLLPAACGIAIATVLISLLLPNQYTSEATILVVQQQVPKRYVTPNTTYSVQEAIQSLTEAVLSRARLLPMISEFGLYPKERKHLGSEGLAELMRHNILIQPIQKDPTQRQINAFKISFVGGNRFVAQKVTDKLTSFFIDENLKLQEQQDTGTTSFLKDQLASTQKELEQQEQQLRDYKMRYLGELPEQQQGNLEILSGLHMQLQNTMAEISRAQEQRVYLSSLLDQYRSLSTTGGPIPGVSAQSPGAMAQGELGRLQAEKASLLARFTPQYPDVLQIDRKIEEQKALLDRLQSSKANTPQKGQSRASVHTGTAESSSVAQLNSQLDANRVQMKDLVKGEKQLEAEITQYEQRLNLTPVREQQLTDIMRNYNLAKKNYADLLNKVTQSEMATSLAMRQQGQQFRVVNPPSLPTKPSSPNRVKIGLGGAVGGLFLAAIVAFLVDSGDHSFYSEKDVSQRFKLPVVIAMPLFRTPSEERRRSWINAFEWLAGTVLVLIVLVAEFYIYRRG
ncbi:MAG TPA: Wzz/FepE/Etk N-terminal domain-containing protein [Terriglobia bacterium]|nr:Wzz/FepE/Etk N-terminal domain-containing protein [Terriglobia bacterium]